MPAHLRGAHERGDLCCGLWGRAVSAVGERDKSSGCGGSATAGTSAAILQLAEPEPLADLLDSAQRRASLLAEIDAATKAGRLGEGAADIAALEALPGQQRHPKTVAARDRLATRCRRGAVRAAWLVRTFAGHTESVNSVVFVAGTVGRHCRGVTLGTRSGCGT